MLFRSPLRREHLDDFVTSYQPGKPRTERVETERFRPFTYHDLVARDKANLDLIWLKDDSLTDAENLPPPEPGKVREPHLLRDLFDSVFGGGDQGPQSPEAMKSRTKETVAKWVDVGSSVLGYVSSFLLSLLFSFLIVLDLAKLKLAVTGLDKTKIGFIYREVADNVATFSRVLGRSLEAQLFIALLNTILTSLGIWILGIDSSNIPVLAAIVFLCSFIPVAGVFISSTPICLLADRKSTRLNSSHRT